MSHISPGSYLIWTVLVFFLAAFFVFHLWSFDRFQSLRWNSGSGAFKRVMIYTYLLSIPVVLTTVLGFAIIKYREGFSEVPGFGIIPTPYTQWENSSKRAIFPLMFMFSLGFSLEMISHLEELCFWLFLLNASSVERSWFSSPYFKTWVVGSIIAILYMPLVSIFTREDPLKNEAYSFLAGSLGSLSITIWFIPILLAFPRFLDNLRSEGVDTATIVRLTKFSELNSIRVVFRFLFTVPIVILGIDGIRPHVHINESLFATDLLITISGVGCVISSAITLVIFFPRSIEGEIAARDAARARKQSRRGLSSTFTGMESRIHMSSRNDHITTGSYLLTSSPVKRDLAMNLEEPRGGQYHPDDQDWTEEERDLPEALPPLHPLRPNRKQDIELGSARLTENNLLEHNIKVGNVNSMISNFTSPIDIMSYPNATNGTRLTFTRR